MYIGFENIIQIAAVLTALGTIVAAITAAVKWFARQKRQDEDIQAIKEEQYILSCAILACLNGLKQLNCDGEVTTAHDKLAKHLNKKAHDMGQN